MRRWAADGFEKKTDFAMTVLWRLGISPDMAGSDINHSSSSRLSVMLDHHNVVPQCFLLVLTHTNVFLIIHPPVSSPVSSNVVDIALITNYFLPARETFPSLQSYQVDL